MSRIALVLAVAGIAVVARSLRKVEDLRRRLTLAAPYMIRSGAPLEEIQPIFAAEEWEMIGSGGNTNPGNTGNIDMCPCQSEYTVATQQVVINVFPNPAQVAACAANPPAPAAPTLKCADDCVQVMTHLWRGFTVVRNVNTGQIKFNCHTFAQYHCKKPDDPERYRPPKLTDPNDPIPER